MCPPPPPPSWWCWGCPPSSRERQSLVTEVGSNDYEVLAGPPRISEAGIGAWWWRTGGSSRDSCIFHKDWFLIVTIMTRHWECQGKNPWHSMNLSSLMALDNGKMCPIFWQVEFNSTNYRPGFCLFNSNFYFPSSLVQYYNQKQNFKSHLSFLPICFSNLLSVKKLLETIDCCIHVVPRSFVLLSVSTAWPFSLMPVLKWWFWWFFASHESFWLWTN